tara:strand:+ start:189 stop:314 length:126 start_codon:yes stop_codon:yes gene_type:complete
MKTQHLPNLKLLINNGGSEGRRLINFLIICAKRIIKEKDIL